MIRPLAILAAAALALGAALPALGDDDQDEARRALERGEIRPLEEVLAAARARVSGDVVKIELDRDDDLWVYEIKILTPSGARREVEIDARSLRVLEVD
ncbi:PepSY domain-containing protein [Methylopila turkensis]|uniref:PepSY domain-containing protein n=1 Tax=Methylopila turkensis TaxID=1437816 RepID=A0A9W6JMK1_9HYPH|nr:PepSY domain-containing protein [Methylopila turkensis]GLK78993.1 hypothetical protein GCM10008174_07340 [Methylopila turkensis]